MNHVVLIGRATRDPDVKISKGDIKVAHLGLAVPRAYKNPSGERDVDFINLVAWRKTAEVFEKYVSKGNRVGVEGELHLNKFITREGEERTTYEVVVDRVELLENSKKGGDSAGQQSGEDDDMPF